MAIMLAKLFEGAVVSMTGCSNAEEVPSLNKMCVDELGMSDLVAPTFKPA